MIENCISTESAEILKKLGYKGNLIGFMCTINWYCESLDEEVKKDPKNWSSYTEFTRTGERDWEQTLDNGAVKKCIYVPVIHLYDAQKWLREQKGLIVIVDADFTELNCYYCNVYNHSKLLASQTKYHTTYEEALNDGILEALKMLNCERTADLY